MALIEVKPGAKAGAFIGEDGAYPATLVAVEGPRTITPKDGREPFELMEWTFAVEGAPDEACLVWASTSTATGPRSRAYGYLTGLLGGKAPAVGQAFEAQDLVGRMAMIDHPARRGGLDEGRERRCPPATGGRGVGTGHPGGRIVRTSGAPDRAPRAPSRPTRTGARRRCASRSSRPHRPATASPSDLIPAVTTEAVPVLPTNEDRIRAALWFAEHGFGVFPVLVRPPGRHLPLPGGSPPATAPASTPSPPTASRTPRRSLPASGRCSRRPPAQLRPRAAGWRLHPGRRRRGPGGASARLEARHGPAAGDAARPGPPTASTSSCAGRRPSRGRSTSSSASSPAGARGRSRATSSGRAACTPRVPSTRPPGVGDIATLPDAWARGRPRRPGRPTHPRRRAP